MTDQELVFAIYFLIIGGFGFLLFGAIYMWRVISFQEWGLIPGQVLGSWIEVETDSEGDKIYRAVVDYSYVVEGKLYTSRRIKLVGTPDTDHYTAQKTVQRYSKGKKINVYVNPKDPHQATLKLGQAFIPVIMLVLGIVFMVAGIVLALSQVLA